MKKNYKEPSALEIKLSLGRIVCVSDWDENGDILDYEGNQNNFGEL